MNRSRITFLALTSPWVITFACFWLFPLLASLLLSFTDYRLLGSGWHWIGFHNYARLFSDLSFLDALGNTLYFVIGTIPITTALALALALLVNGNYPGRGLFRSGFFLPSLTSLVVIALIFTNLYSRGGYLAGLAALVGLPSPENGFLYDRTTALPAIMLMDIWMSCGYYMLIFLAGLQAIPKELYEAADVAGASRWKQLWSITLPLLRPTALYIVVINSIKSFQVFTEIFVMTRGKFDTGTLVYFVYDTGLSGQFEFGYASAAAYLLFVLIAIISWLQFALLSRRSVWL